MKSRPFGAIFPQKREKVPESRLFWRKQDASLAPSDMAEPRKAAKKYYVFHRNIENSLYKAANL